MKQYLQGLSCAGLLFFLLSCGSANQSDSTAGEAGADAGMDTLAAGALLHADAPSAQDRADQEMSAPPDMHNAENSLDIAGTYTGVLPCADCEGVETKIDLNPDGTAMVYSTYLGEDNRAYVRTATWKVKGSFVYLKEGEAERKYFAGENYLKQYNGDGKEIEGELAERFILRKQ